MTGATGTGKTMTAILKGMLINRRRFDASFYVTMPKEFIDKVEDSKTGDVIIWDEAGVGLSARQWYSLSNILSGQTLQTYRERNLAVFFCTPDTSFIDVQARKLINAFSEIKRYNSDNAFQYLYKIEIDRKRGNIYYPWFSFIINNKRMVLSTIKIPRSIYSLFVFDQKILKEIREKASDFKTKVLAKNRDEATVFENERFELSKTVFDIANEVSPIVEKYRGRRCEIDWHLLAADYNLSRDKATQVIGLIKRGEKASTSVT